MTLSLSHGSRSGTNEIPKGETGSVTPDTMYIQGQRNTYERADTMFKATGSYAFFMTSDDGTKSVMYGIVSGAMAATMLANSTTPEALVFELL